MHATLSILYTKPKTTSVCCLATIVHADYFSLGLNLPGELIFQPYTVLSWTA